MDTLNYKSKKNLSAMSAFFKALGDPTRLRIVSLLTSSKKLCVHIIAEKIGMTQPAISQHLKILKHAGIVDAQKIGLYVHYRIDEKMIAEYSKHISSLFMDKKKQACTQCPEKPKA